MISSIIETIFPIGLIILILFSAFHWIRTGFWVPKYIHFIAFFMLLVAGSLAFLAHSVNDKNANITLYLIIGFPVAVYIIYGLYGGGIHSKDIKINDGLIIDRAMLKDEVIEIFKEHFAPYTKWDFENLLLLSESEHQSEIKGKSGKSYLFELGSELNDEEEDEEIVAIYGRLTEFKKKCYKPQSHVVFEVNRNGTVYLDGLNKT